MAQLQHAEKSSIFSEWRSVQIYCNWMLISRFETQETRALLAGNAMANFSGSELDLIGDTASNSLQVWQSSSGTWKVQGIGTNWNRPEKPTYLTLSL